MTTTNITQSPSLSDVKVILRAQDEEGNEASYTMPADEALAESRARVVAFRLLPIRMPVEDDPLCDLDLAQIDGLAREEEARGANSEDARRVAVLKMVQVELEEQEAIAAQVRAAGVGFPDGGEDISDVIRKGLAMLDGARQSEAMAQAAVENLQAENEELLTLLMKTKGNPAATLDSAAGPLVIGKGAAEKLMKDCAAFHALETLPTTHATGDSVEKDPWLSRFTVRTRL